MTGTTERPGRTRQRRRVLAEIETLEGRALMSIAQAAVVLPVPVAATLTTEAPRRYTLLDTTTFTVALKPGFALLSETLQEKRPNDANWLTVATANAVNGQVTMTQRLAGNYEVRAIAGYLAPAGFGSATTAALDILVRFPDYAAIVANADVVKATDQAWVDTKAYADNNKGAATVVGGVSTYPNGLRRELGFWIRLNTGTGKYEFTATTNGPNNAPAQGAGINLGARPADTPSADGLSSTYSVASFHTHTPTTYRVIPDGLGGVRRFGRGVGPSAADGAADTADDVTGVVYDYVAAAAGNIPGGHPLNAAAQLYRSGPLRRSTPRN